MGKGLVDGTSLIVEHLVRVMGNRNIASLVPWLLGERGYMLGGRGTWRWVTGTSLRSFLGGLVCNLRWDRTYNPGEGGW